MKRGTKILVIDDEEAICFAFQRYFGNRGATVAVAPSCLQGLEACRRTPPDIVFLDVRLPDGNGLDLLEPLRRHAPDCRILVVTAFGTLDTVTRAIQGKAFDCLVKPVDLDKASELVERALSARRAAADSARHPPPPGTASMDDESILVGKAPVMQEVYKRIGLVAHTDTTVLVLGETGTGKELVARAIHRHSPRRDRPFVAVNCAALPENLVESELFGYVPGAFTGAVGERTGRLEAADSGTLFLDEIGDLPLGVQVKLLRFLDSQVIERLGSVTPIHLDVRVVAATNRDLRQAIRDQRFREDLFYRLAVLQIELPPLRDRGIDIPDLARHFLAQLARGNPPLLTEEALAALARHAWPGNVRELRNAIAHAAVVCGTAPILPAHLPESVLQARPAAPSDARAADVEQLLRACIEALDDGSGDLQARAVSRLERLLLQYALAKAGGNQSEAATYLGLHRNTLRNKLRELGHAAPEEEA
ncbi:MAG: hypothetical protein A3K19_13880 [Lentisphaerae bacterium RIFOXYB12_FULL_65_16]|nr:MAG: hypothetical protein A3K18_18065 [Lentisphaerae bacterium RIFOXYA12_64_32]OGV94125.1 MAG: hypothetical protein A3K19_13880 [Lentisphaerae bacterium RIFOXYB12_FULL_65_16]